MERSCESGPCITHNDAGTIDRQVRQEICSTNQLLGFKLTDFIVVAVLLPDIKLLLEDSTATGAADIGC